MKPEVIFATCLLLCFAVLEAWRTGFFRKPEQRRKDAVVEGSSVLVLTLITQPLALLGGGMIAAGLAPGSEDALQAWPIIAQLGLLLIFDDMSQYWWHRLSHHWPWLYNLHRPHHDARYMSVRIVYRNNVFYYLLMPGLWFSGALIYLGVGAVYPFYLMVKLAVIIGAHSDVRWDKPLYRIAWLSPLMWLLERTISTPATHAAHHGRHAHDPATHYRGNYGNLLFFWDVLFGTARITRQYPESYGVENLPEVSAGTQLFWPLIRENPGKGENTPVRSE